MANIFNQLYNVLIILGSMLNIWIAKADVERPWILHTNNAAIDRLEMETWTNSTVVTGLRGAVAVDYHYTKGFIYYSEQAADRITRMNLSNPNDTKDIITNTLSFADAIAVDWIYDHLYWIDAQHDHIMVSELDGTRRKTLIDTQMVYLRALVVYPNIGWMFFTDVIDSKIEKCGLDGSNRQAIVTTEIDSPSGLSIDFISNRLYWVDESIKQIKSSTLDGTDIQIIMQSSDKIQGAWGLVVYKEWLYITLFGNNSVCRVDKQTGSDFQIIRSDVDQPVGIRVYSDDNQPAGYNWCILNNGGCEQQCLPTPHNTTICACADGYEIKADGTTCLDKGSGKWLIYANLKTIERLDLETNVTETVASRTSSAVDLDIHYEQGFVYWSDVHEKKISRSAVTRKSVSGVIENIIVETINSPEGIAIDWIYNLLYWTDAVHDHIQVSRLDGTDRKTIIQNDGSLDKPRPIVVDPNTGLLFFSDWGSQKRIERCGMDGGNRKVIIDSDIAVPDGMTIDHIGKRLYWVDVILNQIKSTRFDGTDTHTVIKDADKLPKPFDLVVYGSFVYWSNWDHNTICRVNKYTGQDYSIRANYIRSPMGIQVFADGVQPKGTNVCENNNGGCSHICFPLPAYTSDRSTQSGCMCPDFYALLSNNKTCISIEPPEHVTIGVVSSSVTVSWEFPKTLDHIVQSELRLYDREESVVYTRIQYYPISKHTVTAIQFQECHRYKIKLRCQYSINGWSPYTEHTFWPTENMIYSDLSSNVNITWTISTDRTNVDIMFYRLEATNKTIFKNGISVDNSQKYKNLFKNGLNVQFTLQQVQMTDVGLYQSVSTTDNSVIDGCALLVVTEKPKVPNMTFDRQPFVGSASLFSCSSVAQRHPMYLVTDLQYNWSTSGTKQDNTLAIIPITKTDKGKTVSCSVTDDRGKVSDSSNAVILDPYYGPESVRLTTLSETVHVAKGSYFTVTCLAICYPACSYIWTRVLNGVISDLTNAQTYTIDVVSQSDNGIYSCVVTHQDDSSRKGKIDVLIHVFEVDTSTSVLMTETEFSSPGMTTADAATQLPGNSNVENRQTDKGFTPNDVIIYPVIGAVSVIIVTVVVILICWRRRRRPPPKMARPFEEPDKRVSTMSTVSNIYDTIEEHKELTTNMYNPNSDYLDPYHGLSSSGRNPTYIYSDLMRKHGDVNMQESIVARNENTDIDNDTLPRSSNDESGLTAFSNPVGYEVVDTIWSNENSDNSDYLSPINFNSQ